MKIRKKKLDYNDLEGHVIDWVYDRLDEIREFEADMKEMASFTERMKEIEFAREAILVLTLLDLIAPLQYDEDCIIIWAREFSEFYNTSIISNNEIN